MHPIFAMRRQRGWTLAELSERTNISPQQINRLEKGERRLNEDNLQALADAFGCSPSDLLTNAPASAPGYEELEITHAINSDIGGQVQPADSSYRIPLRHGKVKGPLRALRVEGSAHRDFPEGSELIFAPATSALKHGQTVLVEKLSRGKKSELFGILQVSRDRIDIVFQGKDYRTTSATPFWEAPRKQGFGESGKAIAPQKIPLESGELRITGVLVQSMKPEI